MASFFDVHKNAMENLLLMNCDDLWQTLNSFEGTSNIVDANDRDELLLEAQRQVEKAYSNVEPSDTKTKLFLIKSDSSFNLKE